MTVRTETEAPPAFRQIIHVDPAGHVVHADSAKAGGGGETAPSPHDHFDLALATCKALTAHVYAKNKGWTLNRVTATVERDDAKEREGQYGLTVSLTFDGLSDEQKTRMQDVLTRCPVHKLMTTAEITITQK